MKMPGLPQKINSRKNMGSYTKLMNQCTIELLNINKGKIFLDNFLDKKHTIKQLSIYLTLIIKLWN